MIVYSIMMVIVIGLSICLMKVQNKHIKILCYSGIILAFFCVSGLRYDVGTDYFFRYVPNFQTIAQGEEVKSLEPLFIAIIKGCLLIKPISKSFTFPFKEREILDKISFVYPSIAPMSLVVPTGM